jgi:DNA-binding transcriptional MocR family regulator
VVNACESVKEKSEPIYRKLASRLETMIRETALRPGDRVPSVRHFSTQQRVSIPTALHAYELLETRGLIESRPRSGFFVRQGGLNGTRLRHRDTREPLREIEDLDPLEAVLVSGQSSQLVPLGAALPSPDLLAGIKLTRILGAIGRRLGAASANYDAACGDENLRQVLARRSLDWGCALKADDFIITTGATEALSLALRARCESGQTVIVEAPTYWGLARMLQELGLKALPVPVNGRGIDLDVLEKSLRRAQPTACVVIPNFQNPTGLLMPEENKRRLVQMLSARGITIIEDDIYGDLQHEGARPYCLKAYDMTDSVILCSSFSKTLAPGYRVGYVVAGKWRARVQRLKHVTTLSGAALPVLAVGEFLRNGGYDRYLRSVRRAYREQVDQMREAVRDSFPEGTVVSHPQGGFLLWCQLPERVDSIELFRKARAEGISVAPGPLFSTDGGFRNYIRINCGYRWSAKIERAVGVLGRLAGGQVRK